VPNNKLLLENSYLIYFQDFSILVHYLDETLSS